MIITTHHENDRKVNELSKNILYDLRGTNVEIEFFFALVWIDAELFSRVGRQSGRFLIC